MPRPGLRRVLPVVTTVAAAGIGVVERPQLLVGFLVAALVFVPLEQLLPLVPRAGLRRSAWVDLAHTFANRIPITVGTGVALATVAPVVRAATPEWLAETVRSWPGWLQVAVLLVAIDLMNYLSHRALHEVPLLWRLHAVHHSSTELDWLSTSRGHPIDQILTAVASTLPLYALGVDLPVAGALLAFQFFYPYLGHANTRITLRPLSAVLVTPAFHHWHHASDAAAVNRNYGAVLAVWDHLLGTAHLPPGMPSCYGTADGPTDETWTGHMLAPFAATPLPEPRPDPLPPHTGRPDVGRPHTGRPRAGRPGGVSPAERSARVRGAARAADGAGRGGTDAPCPSCHPPAARPSWGATLSTPYGRDQTTVADRSVRARAVAAVGERHRPPARRRPADEPARPRP